MNQAALSQYFNYAAGQPAQFGGLDCVRFVAEALCVGWGIDYRDRLQYDDRRSAVKRLRDAGGLEAACDEVLPQQVAADEMQPGDIAYFPEPAIGLVMPDYVAVKYRGTIVRVPHGISAKGWRPWARR